MALAVVPVTGVTGAHHPAEMVSALLLAGGASAHVIVCRGKRGYVSTSNTKTASRIINVSKQFIYIQIFLPTFRNTLAQHKLEALAAFLSANKSDRRSCDASCHAKKSVHSLNLGRDTFTGPTIGNV